MRFLTTFKKTKECSFESWLKLVDDLQPHMQKNGLKLIVATETEDGTRIYDIAEAETMEGVEAFMSDPEVIRMRQEAGVDTDSQEVINAVSEYHILSELKKASSRKTLISLLKVVPIDQNGDILTKSLSKY